MQFDSVPHEGRQAGLQLLRLDMGVERSRAGEWFMREVPAGRPPQYRRWERNSDRRAIGRPVAEANLNRRSKITMKLYNISLNNLLRRKSKMLFLVLGLTIAVSTVVTLITVARIMNADIANKLGPSLMDVIVGPAIGGIVVAQEVGRLLNKRTIFAERDQGEMTLRRGFEIAKGEVISVSDQKTTDEKELIIDSVRVASALQVGERIMIEDGVMRLKVVEKLENSVKAEVLNGGTIKPRKGINLPDTKLHFGAVTEKDQCDLEFAQMSKESSGNIMMRFLRIKRI